ncbi:MAG: dTDP-4-dehydrorhamnose 3,5-epimerase [Methanoregula sp.]
MERLKKIPSPFADVFLLEPFVFSDDRGFFFESYSQRDMEGIGIPDIFVQDNHSCSAKGVLRGLHFQNKHPQGKLIRVIKGLIFDAVVDIRRKSPTFGKSFSVELSAKKHQMIWVPVGFAHGFLSLENNTEVLYKTTDFYFPEHEAGIRWDDPALQISWPLKKHNIDAPNLSGKDSCFPLLSEINPPFEFGG